MGGIVVGAGEEGAAVAVGVGEFSGVGGEGGAVV